MSRGLVDRVSGGHAQNRHMLQPSSARCHDVYKNVEKMGSSLVGLKLCKAEDVLELTPVSGLVCRARGLGCRVWDYEKLAEFVVNPTSTQEVSGTVCPAYITCP